MVVMADLRISQHEESNSTNCFATYCVTIERKTLHINYFDMAVLTEIKENIPIF